MHAEVPECCCFYPIQPVAEVHVVEVHVQDLLFRVLLFKPVCNDNLLDFAWYRNRSVMEDGLTCQLLGKCARATNTPPEKWIDKESSYDAAEIDGSVAEESLVLRGDERFDRDL